MAVSGKERLQAMLDAAKGGPIVFHDPAEMMAITADDFPADASIVIHTTIGVLNPSVSGPWSVRNGRFLVNVIHGVRLEDCNVPVTPELFSRIERVAIEERARGANDIEYVASRIRPTPEMACAVQYTIKPEDSRLMVAYIHAYNVRKHIQEICYRAAALKYVDRVSKHVSNKSDIERRMFEHAEIFRNAADGLYRQACGTTITDDVRKILVDAEIMNRAFATELFICLLYTS